MSEMGEREAEPAWMTDPDRDDHEIQFADEEPEPEPEEYDPGPEVDDMGGASEYRHYPEWQEIDRAEAAAYGPEAGG